MALRWVIGAIYRTKKAAADAARLDLGRRARGAGHPRPESRVLESFIREIHSLGFRAQGEYKIVDLRPGAYTVAFALSRFSTFKRECIELTSGFTAPANAEMRVGAPEETVTVTGASPLVSGRLRRDTEASPFASSSRGYANRRPRPSSCTSVTRYSRR